MVETTRSKLWQRVSETDFERWVVRTAIRYGWCGHHVRRSVAAVMGVHTFRKHGHDDAYGALDWQFWNVAKGRYLQRELKSQYGRVSRHQKRVLADLVACGVDAKVWFPSDEVEIVETFAA